MTTVPATSRGNFIGEKTICAPAGIRYGLAVALFAISLGIKLVFQHFNQPFPFSASSLVAITITVWYCGQGPAVLALGLSYLAMAFVVPPIVAEHVPYHLIATLLVVWISAARLRAERLLRKERTALDLIIAEQASKLRQAHEELVDREELYRVLAENTNDFIRMHRLDGASIYASPSVARLYGRNPASLFEFAHPDDIESARRWWAQVLAGDDGRFLWRVRNGNGHWRWLETQASFVQRSGQPFVMTVCRDVTEQKEGEDALRGAEQQQRQLAQQLATEKARLIAAQAVAKVGSWETDTATDEVTWSDETHRIFETDPRRFRPTHQAFLQFVHPEDRARVNEVYKKSLNNRSHCAIEHRILMPDQRIKIVEERWQMFFDDTGKATRAVGTCHDITERKGAEKALRQANDQLHILSRRIFQIQEDEKRHLARELHDQIGQTLTAAKLNLKIVAPDVSPDAAERLGDSIEILDQLLDQVRQLSLNLRPPMLDELGLVPALRWLADQQAQCSALRVTFTTNIESLDIDPTIQTACFRVAQEAITNAIRHARAKALTIDVHSEADDLLLDIRDDGIGFDPAGIHERALHGQSLGLLGMQERVLLVGGTLEVHSRPGGGAEIRARFPLATAGDCAVEGRP